MNIALIALVVIATAACVGIWRTLRSESRHRGARIALQVVAPLLIYLALFPPQVDEHFAAGTLIVLTPGATADQAAKHPAGVATVALPGTIAARGVEAVPDLGTALRRHPQTARLLVVGGGLPARDLDAARTLPVELDPAPLPDGLVELAAPASVRAGSTVAIRGRVQGSAGGRVELRDPGGTVVARAPLADDGAFALETAVKSAGSTLFDLRVLDRAGATVESVSQPVAVLAGDALRMLVLAGAPDPELKYLGRWAADAGVDLASRIVLSDGVAMQDGDAALDADALARTDVVVVDERAWKALDTGARTRLRDAARNGLGLFLRVTGPLPDDVAADWRALGFRVRAADVAQTVALESGARAPDAAIVLSRRALLVESDGAAPLVRGGDGTPAALWRGDGLGRVAIWWLADTYRIALDGDAATFGTLWSGALATIARARGSDRPALPDDARVDRRDVLCGLADGALVEPPHGERVALSIDADVDAGHCAAYWPAEPGWHALVDRDRRWPFYVRAANATPALGAARDAEATRMLAANRNAAAASTASRPADAPRWPFFLAWLVAASLLWWLERSRPRVSPD